MSSRPKDTPAPLTDADLRRLNTTRMSGAEIARMCGLSRQRVNLLLRQGRTALEIVAERRGGSAAKPGTGATGAVNSPDDAATGKSSPTLVDLQKRRLEIKIERERMQLEAARGQLRPAADFNSLVQLHVHVLKSICRRVRELPFRICDHFPQPLTEDIRAATDKEIEKLIEEWAIAINDFVRAGRFPADEQEQEDDV